MLAVTLGDIVAWGNVPTWVEGHGFVHEQGTLTGEFIAREGLGVAYAMRVEGGRIAARFGKGIPGFHEFPHTGERLEGIPAHGASARRIVTMVQAQGRDGRRGRAAASRADGERGAHAAEGLARRHAGRGRPLRGSGRRAPSLREVRRARVHVDRVPLVERLLLPRAPDGPGLRARRLGRARESSPRRRCPRRARCAGASAREARAWCRRASSCAGLAGTPDPWLGRGPLERRGPRTSCTRTATEPSTSRPVATTRW